MRWRFIPIMLIAALVGASMLTACATTRGSGRVVSESRDVSSFTAVELAGIGTLMIEQTGTESLVIEAEDNILPVLTSDVSSGILRLGKRNDTSIAPTKPIIYHLTVKDLNSIRISGSGEVVAPNLEVTTLTVDISGSGNATVGGTADTQQIQISGSGRYMAEDLETKAVKATASGSGDVVVRVSDTLDATISGSGSIAYIGDPTVSEHITGSGTITKR
jgi:predicted small secreted protein